LAKIFSFGNTNICGLFLLNNCAFPLIISKKVASSVVKPNLETLTCAFPVFKFQGEAYNHFLFFKVGFLFNTDFTSKSTCAVVNGPVLPTYFSNSFLE